MNIINERNIKIWSTIGSRATLGIAALELAKRNYFVIRMGKNVEDQFDIEYPNITDYANSEQRNDFLDIWLMARCQFAISTGTGTDMVTNVFKKPVVYVNFLPAMSGG